MRELDKEELDALWKHVEYIGTIDYFDDSRMLALGSVFGKMIAEIESLQDRNNKMLKIIHEVHDIASEAEYEVNMKEIDDILSDFLYG